MLAQTYIVGCYIKIMNTTMTSESDSQVIFMVQLREQHQVPEDNYTCNNDIKWISTEKTATFKNLFDSILDETPGYITSDHIVTGVIVEVRLTLFSFLKTILIIISDRVGTDIQYVLC